MKEVVMLKFVLTSFQALADVPAAATAAAPQQAPAWMQFVPFVIILGVMYFVVIRPQAKRQKETQNFLNSLKVGDQIVTQAGILGRITSLSETIANIEIANQVQIKILRSQILMNQAALQTAKKEGN
jgi:preprotein translocase subunit YajC